MKNNSNIKFKDNQKISKEEKYSEDLHLYNKSITPGEVSELIRMQKNIDSEIRKWVVSIII